MTRRYEAPVRRAVEDCLKAEALKATVADDEEFEEDPEDDDSDDWDWEDEDDEDYFDDDDDDDWSDPEDEEEDLGIVPGPPARRSDDLGDGDYTHLARHMGGW